MQRGEANAGQWPVWDRQRKASTGNLVASSNRSVPRFSQHAAQSHRHRTSTRRGEGYAAGRGACGVGAVRSVAGRQAEIRGPQAPASRGSPPSRCLHPSVYHLAGLKRKYCISRAAEITITISPRGSKIIFHSSGPEAGTPVAFRSPPSCVRLRDRGSASRTANGVRSVSHVHGTVHGTGHSACSVWLWARVSGAFIAGSLFLYNDYIL